MMPRPMSYPACQQFDWYESINKPTIMTLPSSPRRGGRKNSIEQTFYYSPLYSPRIKVTTIFFLKILVLSFSFLRTPFFQTQYFLVLWYMTILFNHVPETRYLVSFWFVLKFASLWFICGGFFLLICAFLTHCRINDFISYWFTKHNIYC